MSNIDSASEQWSFENFGQSTDSGYPLRNSNESHKTDTPPTQTQPTSLPRVLSGTSVRALHLQSQQRRYNESSGASVKSNQSSMYQQGTDSAMPLFYSSTTQSSGTANAQQPRQATPTPTLIATPTQPRPQSIMVLGGPSQQHQQQHQQHQNQQHQNQQHQNQHQQHPLQQRADDEGVKKTYGLGNTDSASSNAVEFAQTQRIRIERDYSTGDMRQFSLDVPVQLQGRIDEQRFKRFVRRINGMLAEAEGATLRNVLEGCLAFATLYLSTLIIKPHFRKTIDRISRFIAQENESFFAPMGLVVLDPQLTAFMFIEIAPLN
ncbi:hypothetical protein DL89DRAFT_263896 [Linderina pennispora]|uniref:Ras modification protein ERF4 n=1 Tax=Linderina pennispora TaxID=61395 RepID=A0A1Y1WJX0_9FUNG|nr:uncharacterized protein DL89DRAFT_263896 [Linderina pennispora]ORX73881.1 hypothetical protein DL89DRAFT_263896 [Linderina pennispora]